MSVFATPPTTVSNGSAWNDRAVPEYTRHGYSARAQGVEDKARQCLENHRHFRGRSQWINFCCLDDSLYLEGTLPSYYLKQSAQEALRGLGGIKRIVNLIQVVSPGGFVGPPHMAVSFRKPR